MILSGVFFYELAQLVPNVDTKRKHATQRGGQEVRYVSDRNHLAILGSGNGTFDTGWQLPSSLAKGFFTKSLSM